MQQRQAGVWTWCPFISVTKRSHRDELQESWRTILSDERLLRISNTGLIRYQLYTLIRRQEHESGMRPGAVTLVEARDEISRLSLACLIGSELDPESSSDYHLCRGIGYRRVNQ
jgi:hypothetical protein